MYKTQWEVRLCPYLDSPNDCNNYSNLFLMLEAVLVLQVVNAFSKEIERTFCYIFVIPTCVLDKHVLYPADYRKRN